MAAKLAKIATHAMEMRIAALLGLLTCFSALVLEVALYATACAQDRDLAMLVLICRVAEGLAGLITSGRLAWLWLATASSANAPEPVAAHAPGAFLLKMEVWRPSAAFSPWAARSGPGSFCVAG